MVDWLTRARIVAAALTLAACAGGTAAPTTPAGAPEASPAAPAEPGAADPDALAAEPTGEPQSEVDAASDAATSSERPGGRETEASEEPSSEDPASGDSSTAASAPEPAPRPSDIVTAPGVIYILDYQASDVSKAAREKCDQDAGEDMDKRAECLKKERDKFRADALRFKRGDKGKLNWHIYRRDGDGFKEVHLTRFEFADESASEVTLVPKGGAMGARPLFRGRRKVVLGVPSTYSLIIEDPQYGRLVYKARFESGGG